jgi:hypothetical protein
MFKVFIIFVFISFNLKSVIMRKSILSCIALIIIFCSCNNSDEDVQVEFVEPVDADSAIIAYNNVVLKDTTFGFQTNSGAPTLWQSFEVFFKQCVKNSNFPDKSLFGKYQLLYLGPTNPRYLGTIYSHDGVVSKTELTKWIPSGDMESFIAKGISVPSCDIAQMRDKFLQISIGSIPFSGSDSTLRIAWQNQDTITNSIGSWTIDGMNTEEFLKYLNETSTNKNLNWYKKILVEKNNIVSFQVVKVTGFSADITSSKQLTLQAETNIPLMKTKTSTGADSTLFSFKYRTINNKTVHVESTGEFYVFALAMKGKKV